MTTGLSSKVKVALSLLPTLLLAFTCARGQQNILEKKVTVNFLDIRISEALQQIGRQANVHFIYSSNVVEPGRKITYATKNATLTEIFDHLGEHMNLEFKAQNQYVIVRKRPIPAPPTLTMTTPTIEPSVREEIAAAEHVRKIVTENTSIDLSASIHRQYLRKLDSLNLTNTFLKVGSKTQMASPQRKFYAAVGLYVNDFSGGLEVQAGIRSLYGVLNAGISEGKYLRTGFGVGTNIHLFKKFSVSPVYTFASLKEISSSGITQITEGEYKISAQQHQLKLMFQYPFAKNFSAKVGPTFNLMTLNFKEQADRPVTTAGRPQSRYNQPQNSQFGFSGGTQRTSQASPETSEMVTSWVGFEAGIYYSLNFSRRR